jgi:hypothetical protein
VGLEDLSRRAQAPRSNSTKKRWRKGRNSHLLSAGMLSKKHTLILKGYSNTPFSTKYLDRFFFFHIDQPKKFTATENMRVCLRLSQIFNALNVKQCHSTIILLEKVIFQ